MAGREYDGGKEGLRVTSRWALKEVSVTPIGADAAAKMRKENFEDRRLNFEKDKEKEKALRPGHGARGGEKGRIGTMNEWLKKMLVKLGD